MNCPKCNIQLLMTDRQGVEIDYCPNCRGIWLDRGELDKIIERSNSTQYNESYNHDSHKYDSHKHDSHRNDDYKRHKQKNWLSELFD